MNVAVIGHTQAGKSTVAAIVAELIQGLRKASTVAAVVSELGGGVAYESLGWGGKDGRAIRRTRVLHRAATVIHENQGGIVVIDSLSALGLEAVGSYQDQINEARERNGLPQTARMTPDSWRSINDKLRQSITVAAMDSRVDLVEVHRAAQVVAFSAEYGPMETDGLKGRGMAEAAAGASILLEVRGGLRDRYRRAGARQLTVVTDASRRAVGNVLHLPELRSPGDLKELRDGLRKLLVPSLKETARLTDAERDGWEEVVESPDVWDGAREQVEGIELALLLDQIRGLLAMNGLDRQTAVVKEERLQLTRAAWGIVDVENLKHLPPESVRAGMVRFQAMVAARGGNGNGAEGVQT